MLKTGCKEAQRDTSSQISITVHALFQIRFQETVSFEKKNEKKKKKKERKKETKKKKKTKRAEKRTDDEGIDDETNKQRGARGEQHGDKRESVENLSLTSNTASCSHSFHVHVNSPQMSCCLWGWGWGVGGDREKEEDAECFFLSFPLHDDRTKTKQCHVK
jgi:hypothetical protein